MKRNLLFLIGILIYCNTSAQNTPNAFADRINYIFQYVDKTQVPTGILQEYGIDFTNIENYNGNSLNDSNKVVMDEWRNIYGSLYMGQVSTSTNLPTLGSINSSFGSYSENSLAILHYEFNSIRSDAISNNLFTASNDQLYDVPNRSQSPYQQNTAFAISPRSSYFTDGTASLVFRQAMFYSNTGKTVSLLHLDDGNGYQQAYWDTPVSFYYSSGGIKTIKAKITYTDATVYESHFNIYVAESTFSLFYTPLPDVPLTAARIHSGSAATGRIQIRISDQNNGLIKKPLIIAEGFDSNLILGTPNTTVDVLLRSFRNTTNYNLEDTLDLASYDIIYLDYTNGTDHIQDNAYLFQDVIKWVNQQKTINGSTEQNVVLGLSMGGLVARWALRDMEQRSESHDVRLNISMDSPHNGAYVPLSAQALIRGTYDFQITAGILTIPVFSLFELSDFTAPSMNLLNSPAAKQMLIYQLTGTGDNISDISSSSDYQSFMTEYHNKGLPQNCQNVAMSNGSSCGTTQPIQPGDYYVNVNESQRLDYGQKFGVVFLSMFTIFTNQSKFFFSGLISVLPNKTSLSAQIKLRALSNQSNQEIYKAQIGIKRKILGFIPVNSFVINQSFNSGSKLPLDSSPGGVYDLSQFADLNTIAPGFKNYLNFTAFCFVPTVSALDLSTNFSSYSYGDLVYSYREDNLSSYPKSTPFAAVKTAYNTNESHTDFSEHSSKWLLSKLQNTTLPISCTSACVASVFNATISSSVLEVGNECFIVVDGVDQNTNWTYSWSLTGPVQVYSGLDQPSVEFYTLDEGNLYVTITITDACGNIKVINETFYISGFQLAVYPNPANDELIVEKQLKSSSQNGVDKTTKTQPAKTAKLIGISLYNDKGKILRSATMSNTRVTLDTRDIPNGFYFLHIKQGKAVVKKQIIIQH